MSAVRMVAYGVLEFRHKDSSPYWLVVSDAQRAEEREDDYKRDELRKLVNDELKRYGLLLQREVVPKRDSFRTKLNSHILYGQTKGSKGFMVREVLHKGDFKECCIKAAELLDTMDRAQIPDTATGL